MTRRAIACVQEAHQTFGSYVHQTVRLVSSQRYIQVGARWGGGGGGGAEHAACRAHAARQIEWTVGPVDVSDNCGHEVISRWTTGIASAGYVYTDSNGTRLRCVCGGGASRVRCLRRAGREFQQRLKDFRPTWPLNDTEPVRAEALQGAALPECSA